MGSQHAKWQTSLDRDETKVRIGAYNEFRMHKVLLYLNSECIDLTALLNYYI